MNMKRNCNLELRLVPPSPFVVYNHHNDHHENSSDGVNTVDGDITAKKNHEQLTIFYDGKVSVCEVTELQATKIIKLASKEMEEKRRRTQGSTTPSSEPTTPLISPLLCRQSGMSMKRSLQRFLQKRKNRIEATSPYHH